MSESSAAKRGLPVRVKMRHTAHFVDELAGRHEAPVGRLVPLSSLEPNPDQPRSDIGDLSDLVESIREKGVLEPILVRLDRESHGPEGRSPKLRIIAGERRYRAALEAGLFDVPVVELDVSAEEAFEITLIENLQRKDLTAFEEAEGYRALAEQHGYTHEQIAKAVGKSRTSVTESFTLLAIPQQLRRQAEALGVRAKSALLEIAKAGDPAKMKALVELAARRGLNRDDLRRSMREAGKGMGAGRKPPRKKPYTFKFRAPDRRFTLNLSFRQATVERDDLISALEQILADLRTGQD